ncbi:BLUF domain-containing protein [Sphingomonas sp. PAMC 26621]|uniref:BLUF domain-containing protein n=1 Tax=Sphingomonas sp. PAMC 26621 TaxID=1112213 RepID=UPI00028A2AF9|nr:BLUF domain-containing protein [Sphingomonas sp. PAMC 26621]
MIRLIYISTARATLSSAELDGILRTSRRNNAAVNVTGLLIVGGRRFLQTLEGPSSAVMQTYERIKGDARHFAAVILDNRPITERSFPGWAMGHQPSGTLRGDATIAKDVAALIAPITDPTVRVYFAEFARKHAT